MTMSTKNKQPATDRPTSILDQRFKYVPASATDLAKKFKAIRREQAALEAKKEAGSVVRQLRRTG
jgi:hypothetical protein